MFNLYLNSTRSCTKRIIMMFSSWFVKHKSKKIIYIVFLIYYTNENTIQSCTILCKIRQGINVVRITNRKYWQPKLSYNDIIWMYTKSILSTFCLKCSSLVKNVFSLLLYTCSSLLYTHIHISSMSCKVNVYCGWNLHAIHSHSCIFNPMHDQGRISNITNKKKLFH